MRDYLSAITPHIQKSTLEILAQVEFGRLGGSLSSLHLITALYFSTLRFEGSRMIDRFFLSKRQASPVVYACLTEKFYPNGLLENQQWVPGLYPRNELFDVISPGSLGMGLSVANGIALASRMQKIDRLVYCLLGDGELQEGQIWEALLFASHQRLSRVCALVDYNKIQMDSFIKDIKDIAPLKKKLESFCWNVVEIDGHCYQDILSAFAQFSHYAQNDLGPTCIIAHTVKGKGIEQIENTPQSHYAKYSLEELERIL